jgi:hypothetical protein
MASYCSQPGTCYIGIIHLARLPMRIGHQNNLVTASGQLGWSAWLSWPAGSWVLLSRSNQVALLGFSQPEVEHQWRATVSVG